jgi:hypothetical protein
MRRSEGRRRIDLAALAALLWALVFGALYAERMIEARAPRLAESIRRAVGR